MTTRNLKAMRTKEKLKEAAIELFRNHNFSEVTVDQIIEKASSSKGAFYTHFKSKHEIFLEVFEIIDSHYLQEVIHTMDRKRNNTDKITCFFHNQMSYIENHIGIDIVRTVMAAELNTDQRTLLLVEDRPMYVLLRDIFSEGQEIGEFRVDISVDRMLNIANRFMHGLLYDWAIHNGSYSLVQEQEILFAMMIREFRSNKMMKNKLE